MTGRQELENYLNKMMSINEFDDYTINGLQIEGKEPIETILTSPSISTNVITEAIKINADAIIVHHGFFWKNSPEAITGTFKNKIQLLLKNEISLFGYHLPLDFLKTYGNNYPALKYLGALEITPFLKTGYIGKLKTPISSDVFFNKLDKFYNTKGTHISKKGKIQKVGIVSGGGTSFFRQALAEGVDAFISGEGTEWVYQLCHDHDVAYSAMGHYKSECIGPKLLGNHLGKKYRLKHYFYEESNPF